MSIKAKEILLTKELAKRVKQRFPNFKVYANKRPSMCNLIKPTWKVYFDEDCPPLQPEMDLIWYEPREQNIVGSEDRLRAIEIKYYTKEKESINQSFYKGIEQALALLQWGFDNVGLWQLFDESFSEEELWNYGGRTWIFIHGRLILPIEYTMIRVIQTKSSFNFEVLNPIWESYPKVRIRNLGPVEKMPCFNYTRPNLLINGKTPEGMGNHPLAAKAVKEVFFLRTFMINWLKTQKDIDGAIANFE